MKWKQTSIQKLVHECLWEYDHNSQKETTKLLTDQINKKMWYGHTMKYYSAVKRNEVLIHATKWMNPEYIKWKAVFFYVSIKWIVQNRQIHRVGKLINDCQEMKERKNGDGLLIVKCFFTEWWNVLDLDSWEGC